MATGLSDLPDELIGEITRKLGDDKFALRATCRKIEGASFHEFATEHFSGKCVHLTSDSLGALLAISRCERLAKYVKEVSVVTALFSEQGFACPGDASYHWRPTTRQSEAYRYYMNDQMALRDTGDDRVMLAEAFKGLPSLKTVALIDSIDCLKEGTDYRGGNKILRQTGTRPMSGLGSHHRVHSLAFRQHVEHLWTTLIHAIAETHGSPTLEEFRTNISAYALFLNPMQRFSFDASMQSKLSAIFKNTTDLRLQLRSPVGKAYKEMVGKFARLFSNLRTLSLGFDMDPNSGPLYHKFALSVDMSRLTSLNLLALTIDAPRLASSITRLRDVTDLKLKEVDLQSGTWPPVLKAMANLERLDHLHLMFLRENGHKSYFLKQHNDGLPTADGLGPGGAWGDDDDDDDDDDDEEGDITDESMPDLDAVLDEPPAWIQPLLNSHSTAQGTHNHSQGNNHDGPADEDDDMSEYVPDGGSPNRWGGERGFYICVKGHEKIAKRLPRFIEEYNVGEYMDGLTQFPVALGTASIATVTVNTAHMMHPPPPGFNALMGATIGNTLGAVGTLAPPNNNAAGANGNALSGTPVPPPPPPPVPYVPTTGSAANTNTNDLQGSTVDVPDWDGSNDEGEWEDEDDALDGGEVD